MESLHEFADLLGLLQRDGVFHQVDLAARAVRVETDWAGLAGLLVIRWQDRAGVVQFLQSLPVTLEEERQDAFCQALVRLNHLLAVPGFHFDHTSGASYYRLTVPLFAEVGLPPGTVRACFRTAVQTTARYLPLLREVASGRLAPEDLPERARSA